LEILEFGVFAKDAYTLVPVGITAAQGVRTVTVVVVVTEG